VSYGAVRLGGVSDSVDAVAVRRWCATGLDALRRHQGEIDALNVYPVPDGDTGTNLVLTMAAAAEAINGEVAAEAGETPLGATLRRLARGALLGARGNSGVILAQLLKGLADALAASASADGGALAAALERASREAYLAVAQPVEGTVLTVGAAAAQAAAAQAAAQAEGPAASPPEGPAASPTEGHAASPAASPPEGPAATPAEGHAASLAAAPAAQAASLAEGHAASPAAASAAGRAGGAGAVAEAAARGAREALVRTPEQLPVLARAGVVDAGGRGLVVLLDALVEVLTGRSVPDEPIVPARTPALSAVREAGSAEFAYEVQFLLDAEEPAIDHLRARLSELGDSLVVVGAAPTWHVHVHVNDVGAAVEAGVEAGRPSRITVTRFADQVAADGDTAHDTDTDTDDADDEGEFAVEPAAVRAWADGPAVRSGRGVVAVCTGDALAALFRAEGATVVPGMPSTAEILAAIRASGAGRIVVLPNDRDVAAVANLAAAEARAAGIRAGVVPTRSPVQGLAALAVRDPRRRFEDDVIAMAEAAGACRYAEVTIASREALTVAGRCQPGDVLALVEDEVNLIGKDLAHTSRQLIDRLLAAGGELVTLVAGVDAPPGLVEALRVHVTEKWPFVELQCYEGGQPHHPLLIGVE
jgi:uncharacterized protein